MGRLNLRTLHWRHSEEPAQPVEVQAQATPEELSNLRVLPLGETTKSRLERSYYDYRIDFFRGLSLIFIFINHIPDNILSYLTSRTITLFDSAEVFMFLAGYSAALGYYNIAPQGIQALGHKAGGRARLIWTFHIALVVIILTSAFILAHFGIKMGYEVFLEKVESDPLQALLAAPFLGFQAPLLDILPMYVIVMLLAPFLIWLRAQGEMALLSVSGLLWLFASRFFPAIPTITPDIAWNFNPFCWQFLFAIGLIFGWRTRSKAPPVVTGDARRVLDISCALFVLFSACVLMTIAFQTIDLAAANRLRAMYFSLNKQCLDVWRIVGLLTTAYLIVRVLPNQASWLKWRMPQWICAAGAASLPIFSLSVLLSFWGKFVSIVAGSSVWVDVVTASAGVIIMVGAGVFLRYAKSQGVFSAPWGWLSRRAAAPELRQA